MNNSIYKTLIKLSDKAIKHNEIPVAALITKDNRIIAKAYNKRNKTNIVQNHAEIIAINKASKKLKTWILDTCKLYVTLKPCKMCEEIIKNSRIKTVYYFTDNDKTINSKMEYIKINDTTKAFEKKLKSFFINLR